MSGDYREPGFTPPPGEPTESDELTVHFRFVTGDGEISVIEVTAPKTWAVSQFIRAAVRMAEDRGYQVAGFLPDGKDPESVYSLELWLDFSATGRRDIEDGAVLGELDVPEGAVMNLVQRECGAACPA